MEYINGEEFIMNYNVLLINNLTNITIEDYFKYIHTQYYSGIDLSFMSYFIDLCKDKETFCIKHDILIEFGIYSPNTQSSHIKDRLKGLDFKEGLNYIKTEEKIPMVQGGFVTKIVYNLSKFTFKKLLIKSQNESKYCDYYLLLETIYAFYNEYKKSYDERLILLKDSKIDDLKSDMKKLLKDNTTQSNQIKQLLNNSEKQMVIIKDTNTQMTHLHKKVDSLLTLLSKFLSGQIDLIYTFETNILDTKVLIIYKLRNINDKTKYRLALRYCGFNQISISITGLLKKTINTGYEIASFEIIGAIQANMITVQQIYKGDRNSKINPIQKQMITDESDTECNQRINDIKESINLNKRNKFGIDIQSNKTLREYKNTMDELMDLDNDFNLEINDIINRYLIIKFDTNRFNLDKMCKELHGIYTARKNVN